jgi:small subunit ribosomal protein S7
MSRRRAAVKREVQPDPKFGDNVVTKFMNCLMHEGKKSVAERIVYGAFDRIQKRSGQDPIRVFHEALTNVRPAVEVRSRRVGGATYQVPVEVRTDRSQALAIRWLISSSRGRSENTMEERLSGELLDAANNRGVAVKRHAHDVASVENIRGRMSQRCVNDPTAFERANYIKILQGWRG